MKFNSPFKKNKKAGTSSKIAELRSPYLKKPFIPNKKVIKREKKKLSILIPPARLKAPTKSSKFFWIFLLIIIGFAAIYGVFFTNFFNIQSWENEEDHIVLAKDNPLNQILAAEKGKNILLINEDSIIKQIIHVKPDIKKIEVKKIFPKKIKVEIEKYPIVANLVDIVGDKNIGNAACHKGLKAPGVKQKKFLIDSISFLADQNKENPTLPYIRVGTVNELTSSTFINKDKADFLTPEKLDYILKAINLFKERFGMKVIDASYFDVEREIHLCTEMNFEIWIDMEKDLTSQLEKLKKALPKLDIYHTSLEYIDLRITGAMNEKVIFKRR